MSAKKSSTPKSKGKNTPALQGQTMDVAKKMAALEAKVEQLELQVAKSQHQLQQKVVSLESKVTVAATSNKQKPKSPVKAKAPQENKKPQAVLKKENIDTPKGILKKQSENAMPIDRTPDPKDVQASPVSLSPHKKANIASSCAFVKVTGPMGSSAAGTISTADDHIASLQLDIDADAGALWISSSLSEDPKPWLSIEAQADDIDFLEMGAVFRSAQVVPSSLRFERVIDTLLLPCAIVEQLDDQNEVPANLCYMTWKYHNCGADGFERFQTFEADFDPTDRIMPLYRHIFGHRQTVQVWFISDAEHLDESFDCLKARCYKELARKWQPCSGHEGNQGEYCSLKGKNRKGVVQFLQQSALTLAAPRDGTSLITDLQKV